MAVTTLANTSSRLYHKLAADTQPPGLLPFNMGLTRTLLALIVLFHDLPCFTCSSHHNPRVVCNHNNRACTVHNAYGTWSDRSTCHATAVVYPSSESELLHAVAMAARRGQPMKVVTSTGHSMPKWACPRGHGGLLISTKNYTHNVVVNQSSMRVTADSGVQLRTLLDTIAKAGLALPYSPYWEGVTLGGLLSTGSHGSSLFGKGSAVHDHVVAMRLVVPAPEEEGYAKIVTLTQHDEWLSAAKVSLGVLGVISQVSFQLEPQFKRRVSKEWRWDGGLEGEILGFGKAHEFGDLTWFPAQHKLLLSIDDRVPLETPGESINAFHGFRPRPPLLFKASRAIEEAAEALLSSTTKCLVSVMQTEMVHGRGAGLKNNKKGFTKFPVIGYQHHMQTSGACAHSQDPNLICPWDLGVQSFFYHESTFMIPLENISNFILDVKKLRDMNPTSLCGLDLYVGILMRFLKKSSAYLGSQADAVAVDITYYRAPLANAPRLHEDVMEEIEQIALFKYGGLPHWGKNRPLAFQGVSSKYPHMPQFYAVRKAMDPDGLFSSEWSNAALGISGNTSGNEDYCALDGLCICDEDRHCAPERGYYCRRGKVYKEAKVCRLERVMNWSNWLIIEGSSLHIQLNAWMQVCVRIVVRTILHLKAFASWVQVPLSLFWSSM